MSAYHYKVYDNQFTPRRHIMDIDATSPANAINKAGFGWIWAAGGTAKPTRKGRGYTNTAVHIFAPETLAAGIARPDFILEREF
jgi:hypothetical protein